MVVLGLWLAVVGYGILYAGVNKLGGGTCSLGDAFQGKCVPASSGSASNTAPSVSNPSNYSSTYGVSPGGDPAGAIPTAPIGARPHPVQ